jgi:hypothetical protein
MKRTVFLTHEDYKKSVRFALSLWYAGKPKGDWRITGTKRDLGSYITNWTEGKLAEVAFGKFLENNWNIKAELDFKIYPSAQAVDQGDIVSVEIEGVKRIPGIKIDVKSTKPTSLWAMADLKEFNSRHYDAYVWVKVDLPLNHLARPIFEAVKNRNLTEIEGKIPPLEQVSAEIAGFAYREEVEKWRVFHKGERVPDPRSKKTLFTAKIDNKAAPLSSLRNSDEEWSELVSKILGGLRHHE